MRWCEARGVGFNPFLFSAALRLPCFRPVEWFHSLDGWNLTTTSRRKKRALFRSKIRPRRLTTDFTDHSDGRKIGILVPIRVISATNKKILRATQKFSATEETRNEHGKIGAGADFQHSAFLPCSFRVSSVTTSLSFVVAARPRQVIRGLLAFLQIESCASLSLGIGLVLLLPPLSWSTNHCDIRFFAKIGRKLPIQAHVPR